VESSPCKIKHVREGKYVMNSMHIFHVVLTCLSGRGIFVEVWSSAQLPSKKGLAPGGKGKTDS